MLILLLSSIIARPLGKRQTAQAGVVSPNNRCYYYYQLGYSYGFYDGYYYASYSNNNLVGASTVPVGTAATVAPVVNTGGTVVRTVGTTGSTVAPVVGTAGTVAPVVDTSGTVVRTVGTTANTVPVVGTTGTVLTKRDDVEVTTPTYGEIPGLTVDGVTDFSRFPAYSGVQPSTPGSPISNKK